MNPKSIHYTIGGRAVILFLLLCYHDSFAQTTSKENKLVLYAPLRTFFERNPTIIAVEVAPWRPYYHYLDIITKADSSNKINYFDLTFPGDIFLLEKNFGKWSLPDSIIAAAIDTKADGHDVSFKAVYDSIFLSITYYSYNKDEEDWDRIYTPVRPPIKPHKGIPALEKDLTRAIRGISPKERLTDSVFIFQAIIGSDSTVTITDQITSENKLYAKRLATVINHSYPWHPLLLDVRKMKCYTKIYVKINSNKTVTVAIKQP